MIYYKDGAKMMRPVLTREEYLGLRNGGEQKQLVTAIRSGNDGLKSKSKAHPLFFRKPT
ncbi:hypothetical protein [Prevotella sp. E13-27]|uniref:hypothetical protein n=1 Tax=Prevotella sp. E13-27 TaxID=2938122 RepID=UPI00200B1C6C|nr:hypothetical protein [Prevotella sp. E13-27]MCK8621711.1 hypothetical protein [Prevotella sp. E13-27]